MLWIASWLSALTVHAQTPTPVQVRWRLPAACPRPARLESDLAAMLGARLEDARALRADVDVQSPAPQRYQLTLRVEGASGRAERSLDLRSCAEVERAVVLLVTTALQMDALDAGDLDDSAPTASPPDEHGRPALEDAFEAEVAAAPEVPLPAERAPPVESAQPRAPRRPASWWLRLGGTLDLAALPGATAGPSAGVGMHLASWRAWIDGRYFLPRERLDPGSSQPAEIGLYTAALGTSLALPAGAVTLGPAAEFELGALRARVLGEYADGSVRTAWVALMAGGHAEVAVLAGVALALDALVGLPLRRPAFAVEDQAPLYRTRTLTARFALGVRVHLGP